MLHYREKNPRLYRELEKDWFGSLEKYPLIAHEWHPTKNLALNLTPFDVKSNSGKKVWWQCSIDINHEWEAVVNTRVGSDKRKGTGCPYCKKRKVNQINCLSETDPKIASEWHPTKNIPLGLYPQKITNISTKRVWWQCSKNVEHVWQAVVRTRVGYGNRKGTGCPYCLKKLPTKTNCLSATHLHIAQQWHPTKNGNLSPQQVLPGSSRKVWWKCTINPKHEWEATVIKRVGCKRKKGTDCPYC